MGVREDSASEDGGTRSPSEKKTGSGDYSSAVP